MRRRFLGGVAAGALVGALLGWAALGRAGAGRAERVPGPEASRPARSPAHPRVPAITVTPEMVRYSHTRYGLYFAGTVAGWLVLWLLLESRWSARLRDLAERRARSGLLRAYLYYPLLALSLAILTLPLAFYSSYLLPHQYGLSRQTVPGWLADRARGIALSAALFPPLVALALWLVRRYPRRWWLGFWLASIPIAFASAYLSPLVIDPLYNRFEPPRDERLRERLLGLAARAGIGEARVLQMDASRRTRRINGYVTGLGGSARIVLWDTLLDRLDEDELAFVMAHEMGHYVERHVPLGIALAAGGSLVVLLLLNAGARAALARRGTHWGIRGLDDLAVVPLALLLLSGLNFLGSPVECAISRTFERRADDFALRLTGDGHAAARALAALAEGNLSLPYPPPAVQFWIGTHPPLGERLERALAWDRARPAAPATALPEDPGN